MKISVAKFQRHICRYQDIGLQHPVIVTRNRWGSAELISIKEYLRLKRLVQQVLVLDDFTYAARRTGSTQPSGGRSGFRL